MARRALGLRARGAGQLAFEINGRPRQNPAYKPARFFVSFARRPTNYVDAAVPTSTRPSHSKLSFAYRIFVGHLTANEPHRSYGFEAATAETYA